MSVNTSYAEIKPSGKHLIERKLRKTYFKLEEPNLKYQPIVYETESWPRIDLSTPRGYCPFICSREEHLERQKLNREPGKGLPGTYIQKDRELIKRIITFCECCSVSLNNLANHLESESHKDFVSNEKYFLLIDSLLKEINNTGHFFLCVFFDQEFAFERNLLNHEGSVENTDQAENKENCSSEPIPQEGLDCLRKGDKSTCNIGQTDCREKDSFKQIGNSGIRAKETYQIASKFSKPKTPAIEKVLSSAFSLQNFNISVSPGSMIITLGRNNPSSTGICNDIRSNTCDLRKRKKRLFSPIKGDQIVDRSSIIQDVKSLRLIRSGFADWGTNKKTRRICHSTSVKKHQTNINNSITQNFHTFLKGPADDYLVVKSDDTTPEISEESFTDSSENFLRDRGLVGCSEYDSECAFSPQIGTKQSKRNSNSVFNFDQYVTQKETEEGQFEEASNGNF